MSNKHTTVIEKHLSDPTTGQPANGSATITSLDGSINATAPIVNGQFCAAVPHVDNAFSVGLRRAAKSTAVTVAYSLGSGWTGSEYWTVVHSHWRKVVTRREVCSSPVL